MLEVIASWNLTQIGLLMDIVGFVLVFLFGGFHIGIDFITTNDVPNGIKVLRIIGGLLIVVGFVLQICGAQ